jgi:hypothetical protein
MKKLNKMTISNFISKINLLFFTILLVMNSCSNEPANSKDTVLQQKEKTPTNFDELAKPGNQEVLITGYKQNSLGQINATLWKNGIPSYLDNSLFSVGKSVFSKGNEIYVAGYKKPNGHYIAMLWQEGQTPIQLSNDNYDAVAFGVSVTAGLTFVVGWEKNYAGYVNAIVWINGVRNYLSNNLEVNSYATAIFIKNNKVYIVGNEFDTSSNSYHAQLWINGVPTNDFNNKYGVSLATSVFVDNNNDIHIAGSVSSNGVDYYAKYWKNGIPINLPSLNSINTGANSVFVYNNYPQLVGTDYTSQQAVRWNASGSDYLNSNNNTSEANSIYIYNYSAYSVGSEYSTQTNHNVAKLWFNNTSINLGNPDENSNAYSVFVRARIAP